MSLALPILQGSKTFLIQEYAPTNHERLCRSAWFKIVLYFFSFKFIFMITLMIKSNPIQL